jgi:acetyl-CoA synthetase
VQNKNLDALLTEQEVIAPNLELAASDAYIKDWYGEHARSVSDLEKFWGEVATEFHWFKPWDKVLEWDYPYAKWFTGAKCNITYNCLDRHVQGAAKNKVALYWEGEDGTEKVYTYRQLLYWVNKTANALKSLGVGKGDRVCIYMPLTPEGIISMLACARIGAVHSVVYAGLGPTSLRDRLNDARAKVIICADIGVRRGKPVELKSIVDKAIEGLDYIEKVVVFRRLQPKIELAAHEVDFEEMVDAASHECEAEVMDSEDLLFILYTSGTTGRPKGTTFVHGGFMVGTSYQGKAFFNLHHDSDIYFCTSDIGWIVGHSYIVYAPLVNGVTCLIREGAPDYPNPGVFYKLIEKYGVTRIFTAPTLVRMLMKFGESWAEKYDLTTLRQLNCAGEPLNPEAWWWAYKHICADGKAHMADNMWQTETAAPLVCSPLGLPIKPGKCGVMAIAMNGDVVDDKGNPVGPEKGGNFVIKNPWPHMFRTIYGDPKRYEEYWNTIPNCYATGDVATKDEDGYIMFLGRSDDVLNPAGHRIGTADVESALVSHPAVAEAAVIGKPDPIKGEAIKGFVTLRVGFEKTPELAKAIVNHVKDTLGPIAAPSELDYVDKLPKTRSGKIMRRLLKAQELGLDTGDTSTLEE